MPHWVISIPQDTFPFASIHPPKVTEPLTRLVATVCESTESYSTAQQRQVTSRSLHEVH